MTESDNTIRSKLLEIRDKLKFSKLIIKKTSGSFVSELEVDVVNEEPSNVLLMYHYSSMTLEIASVRSCYGAGEFDRNDYLIKIRAIKSRYSEIFKSVLLGKEDEEDLQ